MKRILLSLAIAFLLCAAASWTPRVLAASRSNGSGVNIQLSFDKAEPRQLEDTTQQAIVRDYGSAWKSLENSLSSSANSALDANFTGTALDELQSRIAAEKKTGIHTHYVDRGHKLEAIFYSPEGSAMQLHDTADVEIETYDGGKLLSSKPATLHYVVLMTTAEDRWKVRLLQAVPQF